MIFKQKF